MNRPRSSSVTRQNFSDCALVEILHLHDCLRGALFDIGIELNALVKISADIENEININDESGDCQITDNSDDNKLVSPQHAGTNKKNRFEVVHAVKLSGQVASRFHLIWSVFQAHSSAEDEFIWPALKRKATEEKAKDPSCTAREGSCACAKALFAEHEYEEDHLEEEIMFKQINTTLRRLHGSYRLYHVSRNQTTLSRKQALFIIRKVVLLLKQQMDNLVKHLLEHLEKEETECLPIVKKLLSDSEIRTLVGHIMGKRSAEMMNKILNLALCSLPADERADMVSHMKKATTGTYFEKWLDMGGWSEGVRSTPSPSLSPLGPRSSSGSDLKKRIPTLSGISDERPKKMKKVTSSQTNLCQMSTSRISRSRHPSSWYREEDGKIRQVWSSTNPELTDPDILPDVPVFTQSELTPTYHFNSGEGGPVLGCDHYARNCKLRHPETGTLHTCRLCAQEQTETSSRFNMPQNNYCQEVSPVPVLDRNAVSEILCMQCGALQPVGKSCVNPDCTLKKPFAKYTCTICRLYDDDPTKDIYHCPYCNVCRKGKGLNIDFQHCMTCNTCIAKEEYDGHRCIPQRLKGNCPICQEEMFESTEPLRGMKCGHVMHLKCFERYVASCGTSRKIPCPHCKVCFDNMRG